MATTRCLLLGACGLCAAALGAERVLLTDGSESLLALLKANRDANTALLGANTALLGANTALDANTAPRRGVAVTSRDRVEIARLLWGAAADPPPAGPWQLILGSDLTYAGAHAELAATLATLLLGAGEGAGAPMPPRVVLSHEHRKRPQGVQVEGWTDCDNTLQTFAEVRPGPGI